MNKNIINYIKTLSNNENIQELLIKTIGNILLLKKDDLNLFVKENNNKILHIRDWISSIVENDEEWKTPRVLTIDALNNAADKYFEKKNNKIQTIELNEKDEKLIADLGDYYLVKMLTPEALDKESKVMQHCIGHGEYDRNLNNNYYEYLSLRDKFNNAHITLEIRNKEILQLQGKQNKLPNEKYLEKLLPWLMKNKCQKIPWGKIGKYYENGQWFDFRQIKLIKNIDYVNHTTIGKCKVVEPLTEKYFVQRIFNLRQNNNSFNFDYVFVNREKKEVIDNNINKIMTTLNKKECKKLIQYLGDNNYKGIPFFKYGFYYNNNDKNVYSMSQIPDNCEVDGDISIEREITNLPKNLVVNGNLNLGYSFIKELPEGLKVKNDLLLYNSAICKIKDGIEVGGTFDLSNNINLKELPSKMNIGKSLNISGTNILELPKDIKIGEGLYMAYSNIEKLPDNLKINGVLHAHDCSHLKQLPKGLKVKTHLYIAGTKIKEIPEDIEIEGILFLDGTNVVKLPDNLKCQLIVIEEKQIKLIKDTMNFEKIRLNRKEYTKKEFFKKFRKKINEKELGIKC